MRIKIGITFLLLLVAVLVQSQTKGDVELKKFLAFSTSSSIELKWTISAGFTCSGTEIYRSTDGVDFSKIGEILGVCGSLSESESYSFTDPKPIENAINYYRLTLGSNGNSQTISEFFVKLSSADYLLLPNPVKDNFTLYFKNDFNQKTTIELYTSNGRLIFSLNTLNASKFTFNVSSYDDGLYFFNVVSVKGTRISGKFVVQH